MSVSFDPRQNLVVVTAEAVGPLGRVVVRMALDTGATSTVINAAMLVSIGYDPALVSDRIPVTTGSSIESTVPIRLQQFAALGQQRTDFPVLCYTLPANAGVYGLLGLDFLRGQTLTVDFRSGSIALT